MSYRLIEPGKRLSSEQIRTLTNKARQERAEAIAELFGFGFTTLAKVVGLRRDDEKTPSSDAVAGGRA
jgi:hypothetical protein